MSTQRNSQNGRMKALEHIEPAPIEATEGSLVRTNFKTLIAVGAGCITAAMLWSTLSLKVNADGTKVEKIEAVSGELKEKVQVHSFEIKNLDTRVSAIEEWRKEMQQQKDDIKAIRAMLEEQARKDKKSN